MPPFGSHVEVKGYARRGPCRATFPCAPMPPGWADFAGASRVLYDRDRIASIRRRGESHTLHLARKRWIRVDAKLISVGRPCHAGGKSEGHAAWPSHRAAFVVVSFGRGAT